jgi:hypothetical protein
MRCPAIFAIEFAGLCLLGLILLGLLGCSGDSIRQGNRPDLAPMSRDAERERVRDEGSEFCRKYPDDVACKR